MVDWDDLRFLLAVAREGSTAAAARCLGVNQSTVVRRIASLEETLNLRLFSKRRDGYRLTPEGETLLQEATAVEAAVLAFSRRAAALDHSLTGSIRVTTAEGMALGVVPLLLSEFHRRYPGLHVNMLIEDRYQDLSAGEAEVALRAGPPGDAALVGRKLADQAWAVYASPAYVERHGRPETAEDLNSHRIVGFEGALERVMPARWLQKVAPRAEIVYRSNSVVGMLFAAQSGFGLALLPCQTGDREAGLERVLDPTPDLTGEFWILTHPDLHKRPKIRAFFDFMGSEIVKYRPLLIGRARPLDGNAKPQLT